MEEFKKELKALLVKYNANIFVAKDEDDSFMRLQLQIGEKSEDIYTGYRNLIISQYIL